MRSLVPKPITRGGSPDSFKLVYGLLAAAEQGLSLAQVKLAEAYAERPDMEGSHTTACGWFLLAAMGLRGIHLHRARSGYERVASHLTPAQIAEAKCFARDWTPTRPKPAVDLGSREKP